MFPETDFTLLGSQPAILRALNPSYFVNIAKAIPHRVEEAIRYKRWLQLSIPSRLQIDLSLFNSLN